MSKRTTLAARKTTSRSGGNGRMVRAYVLDKPVRLRSAKASTTSIRASVGVSKAVARSVSNRLLRLGIGTTVKK